MTYLPRDITRTILAALQAMPVIVLTGMRQTGKSTFLQNQSELTHRRYVSLDDFAQLAAAKANPEDFIAGDTPITIDEAQRCPELLIAIKRAVDRRRVPGQFILSGSANFLLMKNVSDSLAGRAAYFSMHPFTRRELKRRTHEVPFIRRFFETNEAKETGNAAAFQIDDVARGGMPPVCLQKEPEIWFRGYEQTYLDRDIRDLGRIGNIIAFRNLLHLAAFRTGRLLSQSELARDAKLSSATVANYLSLLEVSCVSYRVAPYLKNKASRLIKSPKFYLGDSGLACFLAEITDLSHHPLKGPMIETYAAQNLRGILDSTWPQAQLCFWNIQGRHEVDFIIEARNRCIAIEIKAAARWDKNDLAGLNAFLAATKECIAGVLACNTPVPVKLGEKLWAIPLSLLFS